MYIYICKYVYIFIIIYNDLSNKHGEKGGGIFAMDFVSKLGHGTSTWAFHAELFWNWLFILIIDPNSKVYPILIGDPIPNSKVDLILIGHGSNSF